MGKMTQYKAAEIVYKVTNGTVNCRAETEDTVKTVSRCLTMGAFNGSNISDEDFVALHRWATNKEV